MHPDALQEPLPPWRPLLRAAREREGRAPATRWLQLATLATDGTPRVRTLVFRGWAAAAQLDLLTDARSDKCDEVRHQPDVELCWLLPRARSQFRLRGAVLTLPPELQQGELVRHWQQLTPEGRALWAWPPPGAALDRQVSFAAEVTDDAAIPASFALLRIAIDQVELLELVGCPHRRRRWRADQQWQEQELNP